MPGVLALWMTNRPVSVRLADSLSTLDPALSVSARLRRWQVLS